ncbi:MAG: hypothetical protein GXO87_02025 [Chlorobi bacterium]|nr:hypothetical protein [Chlorobiota bacterium]
MTVKHIIYFILAAAVVFAVVKFYPRKSEIRYPPGELVKNYPVLRKLKKEKKWTKEDFEITAVRRLEMKARVLGKENYSNDDVSDISPCDLAVGWGPLSNQKILDCIEFSQSQRALSWSVKNAVSSDKEIELHSSDMLVIPSSEKIEYALDSVETGNIVYVQGYLVNIKKGCMHWNTSTRWDDLYSEIVWIEKLKIIR